MTTWFSRLRLRSLAGALAMLLVLLKPTPAQAWFGWLDEWSGPGWWMGVLGTVRVVCFGPTVDFDSLLAEFDQIEAQFNALATELEKPNNATKLNETLPVIGNRLRFLTEQLRMADIALAGDAAEIKNTNEIAVGTSSPVWTDKVELPAGIRVSQGDLRSRFLDLQPNFIKLLRQKQASLREAKAHADLQIGTGVFISLCSPQKTGRASLEVNVNQYWTLHRTPDYAHNERIWFTTIGSSLTWRLFASPQNDFISIGVGAGVYSVHSKGFDGFAGFVIEPVRLDIHGPSAWASIGKDDWRFWAARTTVRLGLTMFPAGFEADAFAAIPSKAREIKPELIPTYGIFFKAMR